MNMGKRLLKYEIKDTWKLVVLIMAMMLVYSGIAAVWNLIPALHKIIDDKMMTIIIFCAMICGIILIGIMMLKRYLELFVSDKAYLKMSVPVNNGEHLSTNLKVASMWLLFSAIIFGLGLYFIDLSFGKGNELFGIAYIFYGSLFSEGEFSLLQKVCVEICYILTPIVMVINVYLWFIFSISLSQLICNRFNVVEKKGVIAVTGLILFNVKLIILEGILHLAGMIGNVFQNKFFWMISENVVIIVAYSLSAVVIYLFCKWIIEEKFSV